MNHPFNICRVHDNLLRCPVRNLSNKLQLWHKNFACGQENNHNNNFDIDNDLTSKSDITSIGFDIENNFVNTPDKDRNEFLSRVEAVLFLSREPLTLRRISMLADLPDGYRVKQILRDLNQRYDKQHFSFHIVEVAGGVQLRTRPEFAAWLLRVQETPVIVRLSSPAMETLAVIAYKQPVHRAEIEKLRGVQCGDLIRQLLEKNLVKIVGRSEELGRPFFYGTTKYFQQIFGLKNLNDLPDYETINKKEIESNQQQ
ncbi:MAG: SMC-Scp complex subunit ScpB [Planctomycetaceae bacterium]|jgi:segregation and condensation protein B|nr:SMC-Scp complex subunit ScpB [Planctomycetaceae bacterium]